MESKKKRWNGSFEVKTIHKFSVLAKIFDKSVRELLEDYMIEMIDKNKDKLKSV